MANPLGLDNALKRLADNELEPEEFPSELFESVLLRHARRSDLIPVMGPCNMEVSPFQEHQVISTLALANPAFKAAYESFFFRENLFAFPNQGCLLDNLRNMRAEVGLVIRHLDVIKAPLVLLPSGNLTASVAAYNQEWIDCVDLLAVCPNLCTIRINNLGSGAIQTETADGSLSFHFDVLMLETLVTTPGPFENAKIYYSPRESGSTIVRPGYTYTPRPWEHRCDIETFGDELKLMENEAMDSLIQNHPQV